MMEEDKVENNGSTGGEEGAGSEGDSRAAQATSPTETNQPEALDTAGGQEPAPSVEHHGGATGSPTGLEAANRKAAASRENGKKSQGPRTEAGKEHSKMNAFQHGRYAARPDPVKLLLEDRSEEEEAERQALRQEMIGCYQPGDPFAEQQAAELADLHFELRRMERVKEVALRRERELLEAEKKRRARNRHRSRVEATAEEMQKGGLYATPDCFQKYGEIEWRLRFLRNEIEQGDWETVRSRLVTLYGSTPRLWRGQRIWDMGAGQPLRAGGRGGSVRSRP